LFINETKYVDYTLIIVSNFDFVLAMPQWLGALQLLFRTSGISIVVTTDVQMSD